MDGGYDDSSKVDQREEGEVPREPHVFARPGWGSNRTGPPLPSMGTTYLDDLPVTSRLTSIARAV